MKQRIKTLCAGGLLSLALFGVAMAGPLEDSRTAYQRGDYTTAMSLLRPLAEQGDAAAQNGLGLMFAQGHGVPQDYAQAYQWFNLAASRAKDAETQNAATHNRDVVAKRLTSAQIAEAQKMAREWKPTK